METGMIDRRRLLGLAAASAFGAAAGGRALAESAANQWFAVTGDDGQPVPNLRVPVELAEEIEDLPGAIWGGPASAAIKLVEFYDYNCPWCRSAYEQVNVLLRDNRDLRIGLVNNPILSPMSAQAAKVELALLKLKGATTAHKLTDALFATPGRIDGPRALDLAARFGADRAEVERVADGPDVKAMLGRQMRLAASLGLIATPSYVIGGAAVLGYPGPRTLARIVADTRRCGTISC
ncbi:thioredoxin domain-containing protein [Enterovirga sp. DB1703]|uniref:Thioredoxin domain-containing protein n=2 Tax=Enterovirga aerilata TaxID=2730920 RepID=A0A849I9P7_9HYPH|nr:thioredoxin domain-containing protein [Enterovirga sp. DB1703]